MRRYRNAKIVATLGPASNTKEKISALVEAGTDVFRLNFSHGTHADHEQMIQFIREIEFETEHPIAVLADLQGPKLRLGQLDDSNVTLAPDQIFVLDLDTTPGTTQRIQFPHPEIYGVITPGMDLLVDDGRLRLKVIQASAERIETTVTVGGPLSSRKGINIPSARLPISSLTPKDRKDLAFALKIGVDWVALSFVQRPEDILEARTLIQDQAKISAKIEKPQALEHLQKIIALSDSIMVARGDLGVEMPLEDVPCLQKKIIQACRQAGKPVVVATQMLESMITNPSPTRAETSDVATAIYEGADAVMLSAESASGAYPVEAVGMMHRIIQRVEADPTYRQLMESSRPDPKATISDAVMSAARQLAQVIPIATIVAFTESGSTALMAARERPMSPIMGLTPSIKTARQLCLVWGIYPSITQAITSLGQMVREGLLAALTHEFAMHGEQVIITAGIPFGISGATNIIRVAKVEGRDLAEQ